jgi:hypothetical protein
VRRLFAQSFDLCAKGFRAMGERFDRATVTRSHVDGEQPRICMLAQCQHMMFHARAAQVNHACFTDNLCQAPDVTVEPDGFGKVAHAKLDAANSNHSRLDHWVTSS